MQVNMFFSKLFLAVKDNRIVVGVLCVLALGLIAHGILKKDYESLQIEVRTIEDITGTYDIRAEYPQFKGLPRSLNQSIETNVTELTEEFKKQAIETHSGESESEEGDAPYLLRVSWMPDQMSDRYVSIALRVYSYTGGAHGLQGIQTYTFDRKDKKLVTLTDLFVDTHGFLDKISGYAISDLKNQLGAEAVMNMIREGASPKMENFKAFTISRDNVITFYFSEYQVAPYASGEQKVMMPLSYIVESKQ